MPDDNKSFEEKLKEITHLFEKDSDFSTWNDGFVNTTRIKHRRTMAIFILASGDNMTPTKLIEEAMEDMKQGIPPMKYRFVPRFTKFKKCLYDVKSEKTGKLLTKETMDTYISDICSFYEFYSFTVPKRLRKFEYVASKNIVKTHCQITFTKKDISNMLDNADVLEKALILAQVSSGLSNIDLLNIKVGQFKNGRHPSGITVLDNLVRKKTSYKSNGIKYVTFFSKEATSAIDEYLKYRDTPPAKPSKPANLAFERRRVHDDSNYLFVKRAIGEPDPDARDDDIHRRLNEDSIFSMYKRLFPCNKEFYEWNSMRGHLMRKYFNNVLVNNHIQEEFSETMMGHALKGSRGNYIQPPLEKLIEAYLSCEDDFTFTNKNLLDDANRKLDKVDILEARIKELEEITEYMKTIRNAPISEEVKNYHLNEAEDIIERRKKGLPIVHPHERGKDYQET